MTISDDTWTAQDCPDDAPDGRCWDCREPYNRPHLDNCPVKFHGPGWLGDR